MNVFEIGTFQTRFVMYQRHTCDKPAFLGFQMFAFLKALAICSSHGPKVCPKKGVGLCASTHAQMFQASLFQLSLLCSPRSVRIETRLSQRKFLAFTFLLSTEAHIRAKMDRDRPENESRNRFYDDLARQFFMVPPPLDAGTLRLSIFFGLKQYRELHPSEKFECAQGEPQEASYPGSID